MSWFGNYIKSSIGAKHLMAITGLMLLGFVLAHMLGNLQIFMGQAAINAYAVKLQSLGVLLWIMRGGLVLAVLVHIYSAMRLVSMNSAARPVKYKMAFKDKSSFASRTMKWGGIILILFLIFHLVQLTLGGGPLKANFNLLDEYGRHDVYNMTVLGFQNVAVAASYLVAMLVLCFHLSHGVTSLFQSLGINHPKYNGMIKMAGPSIATLVLIGNCSMPIAVLAGWVKATV
ncbi:MAG: succinate dehydrogenase cytochrome b subunit [Myxococcales bacterium]|nr:succinate dehydrogenase cytochrome b subunit [Myxococcales bacterium]